MKTTVLVALIVYVGVIVAILAALCLPTPGPYG